ncbi:homeobox protein 5 isoform X14 [Culex pipiens pallens]|uniref:homeobox protein 5 isoform X14 n=1 Tax=Culex pipiens pallens TaxID=42434 RepID=UPI00195402CA|nr:homeobox protein 5 isoform X14 [Culex pipiens pallens]
MDIGMERHEGSATIGTLFQHIVNDMKNSSPLWDDFIAKATKLHACLRAAIQALAAYLEAFQKIADAATNSKGATKEIGTALTRVCLRHKAVETRMKTFTSAIMECLIVPLQEKLEDWKKQVAIIDKDHAKEYKRCRTELKKRSSDTLRLQKKAKKGGHHAGGGAGGQDSLHILVESSMQDVTLRRCELEEVERKSLRAIMVEERSRYCTFVNMLQPVVHDECEVMSELSHLQEAMQIIAVVTKDPAILPQASEELILESKTNMNLYPDSPGGSNSQGGCSNSLGSRKSSVCSISSINSSSSGSPGHQFQRSLSQYSPAIRLKPGESSDSGFCSSPALTSQASTLASQSHAVSTWPPHTQDGTATADRPHTISSAYEKGHQRPALTVYTFQNPEAISENNPKSPANISCRPPLPVRCSSLERPLSTASMKNANSNVPRQCPSPIPAHITKEHPQLQPTYVNMTELASMAASKITNNNTYNNNNATNQPQSGPSSTSSSSQQTSSSNSQAMQPLQMGYQQLQQQPNSPVLSSASSLISPDSSATNAISSPDVSACSTQTPQNTPQTGSPQTPIYSSSSSMVLVGTGPSDGVATGESNGGGGSTLAEGSAGIENKDILKCTGSVLEKTSMFEQQINNNQHTGAVLLNTPTRTENSGRKGEDIYKSTGLLSERDAGATRVTRRSSINTVKPPPPVRRSSSVTPNPNLGTNNSPSLSQQSLVYTSSESLPPPPAYLLDSTAGSTPIPGNVAGTVKALNEIRHKPASPSVLRRAHQNLPTPQQLPTQQEQQQYATTNAYSGTLLHDPASSASSPYYTPQSQSPNAIYSSGESPNMSSNRTSKSPHHQGIYAQPKQLTSMSSFRTASPGPQKQNSGFLAQLNARIAPNKQPQQQSSPQHYQEQPAYTYTTAPSNEPMYHRGNVPDQRSSYNNSTSSNPHHQQQQMLLQQQQQQSTAASHGMYSSGPAQHHHQQQPNGQRDGKNQVYSSTHSQNQQQIQQQQQYYYQPQSNYATQNIYVSTNPFAAAAAATGSPVHSTYSPSSFGKMPRDGQTSSAAASSSGLPTPVVTSVSSIGHDQPGHGHHHHNRSNHQMRTGSNSAANSTANNVLAKTSVGFLENLNARLAEQRLSGKAFAVRSLINSKALPDPRICHESLMDQIKRGATLKRNRTINDRSAPKIH